MTILYKPTSKNTATNEGFVNAYDFVEQYDERGVRKALEYAKDNGIRDVFLKSGDYTQDFFDLYSGICFFGEGVGTRITYIKNGARNNFIDAHNINGFTIKDMFLDMNNQLDGEYGAGELLDLDGVDGGLILGLQTTGSTQEDIDLDNTKNVTIRNCFSYKAGKSGIHISHGCTNNYILQNYVQEANQIVNARGGITQTNNAHSNYYFGNTVKDCWRNYDIRKSEDEKKAIFGYNVSIGGEEEDEINTPLDYNTEG